MEIKFRKCKICGNIIWSFNNTKVICCNQEMEEINTNSVDASFEKHIPNYEITGNNISIRVNHVMEENHYIKWIMMVCDNEIFYKEFNPFEECIVNFEYKGKCILYSYCNLHGLWLKEVE